MKYIVANIANPIKYLTCGNLVSQNGFLHVKRVTECFVLIVVQEGVLYITQNNKEYIIHENQTLLLFPGMEHFGHKPSEGSLSYYWVHFSFQENKYDIFSHENIKDHVDLWDANPDTTNTLKHFIIPEWSDLTADTRITLLFVQLMDFAKRDNFSITYRMHYSVSLLILELTEECLSQKYMIQPEIPANLTEILDWICSNYEKEITATSLSAQFGYNPTYLSSLFKKHTGYPLIPYINHYRIAVSKNLLINRTLKIHTVAKLCGFQDEKHFMKLFRRYENMSPSQYRIAFYKRYVNHV